jgi:hypothetical protein
MPPRAKQLLQDARGRFGSIAEGGVRCFWKIDLYDRATEMGSPDPTDPTVTTRVLTIMLADEY